MVPEGDEGRTAVLLMGYGSPRGPEDLPGFLTEVLGGRRPSEALVQEYHRRYDLIGWSPQPRVTESLRRKLEVRLRAQHPDLPVLLGTKHWSPHVADEVVRASSEGCRRLVAIPLSPYASPWVLRPYRQSLEVGRSRAPHPIEIDLRAGWHHSRPLQEYWAQAIRREVVGLDGPSSFLFLSAHSLPTKHERAGDPYPQILQEMAEEVAGRARLTNWEFTYQSAGNTTEPWLGPDVTERMVVQAERGRREQWIASLGFLFDHLETLYDLDVVVREFAQKNGIGYHRVTMPNDDDHVVAALAEVALAPSWPASS